MKTYEWWVDHEEVAKILRFCCKNTTKTLIDYLIETFNIESPCQVVLRIIGEQI